MTEKFYGLYSCGKCDAYYGMSPVHSESIDLCHVLPDGYYASVIACPNCGEKYIVGGESDCFSDEKQCVQMFSGAYNESTDKKLPFFVGVHLVETTEEKSEASTWDRLKGSAIYLAANCS